MNVKDAQKIVEKSQGENLYKIVVPSTKQEISMIPMTVGMRKTMAKFAMVDTPSEYMEFQFSKLGLIKALDINKQLNDNDLTELDFISVLAQVLQNNMMDDLALNITCSNKECNNTFLLKVDYNKIIKYCEKQEVKYFEYKFTSDNKAFRFILTFPRMKEMLELEIILDKLKMPKYRIVLNPYLFIWKMYVDNNGKEEELTYDDLSDKIEFIDTLSSKIIFDTTNNDSLVSAIGANFGDYNSKIDKIYDAIECPKCKNTMEGVITTDSFFIS